eukprot:2526468-Pleurochrysis_carterae.AAC.1
MVVYRHPVLSLVARWHQYSTELDAASVADEATGLGEGSPHGGPSSLPTPCFSSTRMLAAAVYLTLLPDELLLRCFEHFRLPEIPPALKAMRLTCTAWRERLNTADNLYSALAAIFDGHRSRSSGTGSNRRSLRIALSPKDALAQAFQSLVTRSETLHHMLAVMAQDNRNLTVVRARGLLSRWTPVLLDRVSAVYDVTILMEVCRARVSESVIAAVVNEMISLWGVDPNVSNSKGLSPVLIAANRGLPK